MPTKFFGPNRRRRAGKRVIRGKRTALKGFTALQTRTLMRAIHRSDETKYFARDLLVNMQLDPAIHSPATGGSTIGDIVPLVPNVGLGTGESQRVGRTIKPVKCRVDINIGFCQKNVGDSVVDSQQWANQVYVVMYILSSKKYKNWNDFSASTQWQALLDNGDSTTSPFGKLNGTVWQSDVRDLMKPVETTEFTLLRKKVVKLTKNVGPIDQGVPGNSQVPNLPTTSYRGSFSYKLPELKYDDTSESAAGFPTNSNVMLAIGYCYADNLYTYNISGGDIVQVSPIVSATARSHVWYKDS